MIAVEAPKRIGRPDQQASEDLVRHIVDTAARLFIERGFAGASVDQVAAEAGSGKQTIYRRFGSKEGLFVAVMTERGRRLFEIAARAEATDIDPLASLKETCRQLLDFILQDDMIKIHRILIAEVSRFPDLNDKIFETCMEPIHSLLRRLLSSAARKGQLNVIDVELTHRLLTSTVTGWPVQQVLMERVPFVDAAARERYFEAAWGMFLRGNQ